MKNLRQRFLEAEWLEPYDIIIVGLGGAGNGISQNLAAIGHELHLYDFDKVSEENVIPQMYSTKQLGSFKTDACAENIIKFTGHSEYHLYNSRYDGMSASIMISCADCMSTREEVFNSFCNSNSELFIDTRMTAETFEIYTIIKDSDDYADNIVNYKSTLFSNGDIEEESCTYKATRFNASILHGVTTRIVCNFIMNKKAGSNIYSTPYYYFWNGFFFDLKDEI